MEEREREVLGQELPIPYPHSLVHLDGCAQSVNRSLSTGALVWSSQERLDQVVGFLHLSVAQSLSISIFLL